jgi:hypothetical protein
VVDPMCGQVFDYMPIELLHRVRNIETFAGVLAFDKWTGNSDGRQATFWRMFRERKYTVTFIDHGYCFNAGEWTFPDYPLRGVYPRNEVYADVSGWHSFEPWLARIQAISETKLWQIAEAIPPEWYSHDTDALTILISRLLERRTCIRDLIAQFGASSRAPFPRWGDES